MNRYDGKTNTASAARWSPLALAVALSVLGCGGRAESGDDDATDSTITGTSEPTPASPGGSSKSGSSFGATELGPCHLGFDPVVDPARSCDWLAKGLCYETKLAACACVCPANRQDSVCSSGFDNGPNGRTLVICG